MLLAGLLLPTCTCRGISSRYGYTVSKRSCVSSLQSWASSVSVWRPFLKNMLSSSLVRMTSLQKLLMTGIRLVFLIPVSQLKAVSVAQIRFFETLSVLHDRRRLFVSLHQNGYKLCLFIRKSLLKLKTKFYRVLQISKIDILRKVAVALSICSFKCVLAVGYALVHLLLV